jgi:hypothetical protein
MEKESEEKILAMQRDLECRELKDLSPLLACTALETLNIRDCPLITSLTPLSSITNLMYLFCVSVAFTLRDLPPASSVMHWAQRPAAVV